MNNLQYLIDNSKVYLRPQDAGFDSCSDDSNLYWALDHNYPKFARSVESVILEIRGENDFAPWYWIVKMRDGSFAYMQGECDYTGWSCQSGMDIHFADTIEEVLQLSVEEARHEFEDMISKRESVRNHTKVQSRIDSQKLIDIERQKVQETFDNLPEEERQKIIAFNREKREKSMRDFQISISKSFLSEPTGGISPSAFDEMFKLKKPFLENE